MAVDIRTLRTMRCIMRAGSFAAAARELGYTASAVSQQMAGLEQALGIQLFEREASRVVPTEAAHYLAQRSDEVFELLDQVEIDIARLGAGQAGRLRVGAFNSAGGPLLGTAIARFLVRRREVEITLDEGEPHALFPLVANGSLDLALGFEYDLVPSAFPANLRLTEVMTEGLCIVAPRKHRFARKPRVGLHELASETWVAHGEETPSHQCLMALCRQHGFTPRIAFRSNNPGTVQGIVKAGLAIALMPEITLRDATDATVVLAMAERLPQRKIMSAVRASDPNPLVDAFVTALRQVAAD
ncbi:LysR family transcriptional regulator [Agrococcus sp. 1P02AA]|uniref:LysR family transcriptional regulator n=1 Tax=Agrococcus sp. 1P02AA TaxID=3132259 RepID=UPI0039A6664A